MMGKFTVEIEPSVPPALVVPSKLSLDGLDYNKVLSNIPGEYNIRYYVEEESFTYYPASILTITNDIFLEWELTQKRESHNMTLSGYTVLTMIFKNDYVYFIDPTSVHNEPEVRQVGGRFDPYIVENMLKKRVEDLLYMLRNASK